MPKSDIDYQNKDICDKGREAEDVSKRRDTKPFMTSELCLTCPSPTKKGQRLVKKTVTENLRNSTNLSSSLGIGQTDFISKSLKRRNQSSIVVDVTNKPKLNNYKSGGNTMA